MLDGIQEVPGCSPSTPPRLRIAVGRKTGAGGIVMDPPLSQADIDAHLEASYVRPAAKAVAS
ncbi:hypothetical protein PL81_31070 [Streptomyces sp. RSD-27]|nr:hypothetical protein PL81_31070 [Streptomyces sp. RSD-27]